MTISEAEAGTSTSTAPADATDFAGRTVWITGASSGIGRSLALELAERGAAVILSGRQEGALAEVREAIAGPALVIPFETTEYAALDGVVATALGWRGGVDLLVNNAGISQRSLAIDTEFEVYRRIMEVDFFAPVRLTQLVLPHMIARRSGRIAVTASIAGKVGVPLRTGYSAAKHAVIGWFDALRAEVETAYDIGVSVIIPGSVQSSIASNALAGDGRIRGRSDDNIANGMAAVDAGHAIANGLAAGKREILVAEGREANAVMLRAQQPEMLFAAVAEEGRRLAEARDAGGADWQPDPTRVR